MRKLGKNGLLSFGDKYRIYLLFIAGFIAEVSSA
jgi:hypothetical protein